MRRPAACAGDERGVTVGAWGAGPFSNDDAADFLADLADLGSDQVQASLNQALQLAVDEYIELPDASIAIAAAALVAMRHGYMPPEDAELAAGIEFESTRHLQQSSAAALRRVQGAGSEWAEVWDHAAALGEAERVLADMQRHLS